MTKSIKVSMLIHDYYPLRGLFKKRATRGNFLRLNIDLMQIRFLHQMIPFSVLTALVMVRYTT